MMHCHRAPGAFRAVCFVTLFLVVPARAQEFSLDEALSTAYMTNPKLEAQRAALRALDEDVAKAYAGLRPQLSASGSYGIEKSSIGQVLLPVPNGHPRDVTVTVTQPVFDAHALAGVRQANASVRAGRAQLTSTEQGVLLDAAQAYFDVVADEAALDSRRQNVQLLQEELGAVRTRFLAGDVTTADVDQVTARLAGATADVSFAQSKLGASRAAFERAVGRPAETLQAEPRLPNMLPNEQMAQDQAEERNPDVVAARETARAADAAVAVAEAQRLPQLSLQGQYLKSKDEIARGVNETALSVMAQLRVPIYQGGGEYADTRKARELQSQAVVNIESAMRQTRESLDAAWQAETAARDALALYQAQVRAAESAYAGLQEQARAGERTVIDVLNAAQDLLTARLSLTEARHQQYLNAYRLNAAVGQMTAMGLNLSVTPYDPRSHYDKDIGILGFRLSN